MRQSVREMINAANDPESIRERRRKESMARIPVGGKVPRGEQKRKLLERVKHNINAMEYPCDSDWTRKFIALAVEGCAKCGGTGARFGNRTHLCGCVKRAIFDALHTKYHNIASRMEALSSCVPTAVIGGKESHFTWGMKNEEFSADFYLLAKRVLDAQHFRVFQLHIIDGWDWRYCCERLGINRGAFFHAVYRLQEAVGLAAVELRPYPLYPIDEYLGAHVLPSAQWTHDRT